MGSYIGDSTSFGKASVANHKDLDQYETESKMADNHLFVSATETEFTQRLKAIAGIYQISHKIYLLEVLNLNQSFS